MKTTVILSLFRGENYLREYLRNLEKLTLFPKFEFLVRAVLPSKAELEILKRFQQHTPVPMGLSWTTSHEPLGRTWNELIAESSSEFIAIWNVDDLRYPQSLTDQQQMLLDNPESAVAIGPFFIVGPGRKRRLYEAVRPTQLDLQTGFHLGPFPMFRKSAVVDLGGFDEQFVSACDYDLALRLAERGPISWTPNVLGEFTNSHSGLSTATCTGLIERTAIDVRYGLEWKVNPIFRGRAQAYDIHRMTIGGLKTCITESFGEFESVRARNGNLNLRRRGLVKEFLIYLRCALKSVVHLSRIR